MPESVLRLWRHFTAFHKTHRFLCKTLFALSFASKWSYPIGMKQTNKQTQTPNTTTTQVIPKDRNPSHPNVPVFQLSQVCPSCWGLQAAPPRLGLWSDPCRSWRILSQQSGQLYQDQKIPPSPEKDWSQSEAAGEGALLIAPLGDKAAAFLPASTPNYSQTRSGTEVLIQMQNSEQY